MVNFAIVEDNKNDSDKLKKYIADYCVENGVDYSVSDFADGLDFLEDIKKNPHYDVVFFDIEMPMMNGMDCARKLRSMGNDCCIIFVTNMIQFAIQGYEVDAKGYVLKPINYARFSREMKRIFAVLEARAREEGHITVSTIEGKRVVKYSSIEYIEVKGHTCVISTEKGDFITRKALSELEKEIETPTIARCSSSFMVNLKYIASINGTVITLLDGRTLTISRSRKEEFIKKFIGYTKR